MSVEKHRFREHWTRSLAKAASYRVVILVLDFASIYFFTGKAETAFGFMLVSNVYTSIAYYVHERVWDRTNWGKRKGSEV